jgi:hypothetical protein
MVAVVRVWVARAVVVRMVAVVRVGTTLRIAHSMQSSAGRI